MRPCLHLITGDTPTCSLGVSPLNCASCTMYQMQSRRTSQQPVIDSSRGVALTSNSDGVVNGIVKANVEQNIVNRSAVSGGCGCKRG